MEVLILALGWAVFCVLPAFLIFALAWVLWMFVLFPLVISTFYLRIYIHKPSHIGFSEEYRKSRFKLLSAFHWRMGWEYNGSTVSGEFYFMDFRGKMPRLKIYK